MPGETAASSRTEGSPTAPGQATNEHVSIVPSAPRRHKPAVAAAVTQSVAVSSVSKGVDLANGSAGATGCAQGLHRVAGGRKLVVIFLRYSNPDLQSPDSAVAQEKLVWHTLDRLGIDHSHALVLCEQGIRGDLECESHEAFDRVLHMIQRGEVAVLAVDQQSRFSRGCNIEEMIMDLVYYEGRFVTADGTDTNREGWQMMVGIKGIQSRAELRDIGHRVRRQQTDIADRVDGCVGDQPYGYSSEFLDPAAAAQYHGRGPKPRKRTLIDPPSAAVVRMIFILFVLRCWSISKIVRYLNGKGTKVPAVHSKRWKGWHHALVHRILSNPKYIGIWRFGCTTTLRSGRGKKKQVPAKEAQQIVTTQREHLRLIPQATWDKAQEKLAHLKKAFGQREGQLRRGTPIHYTELYPTSLLGGVIYCSVCGHRLHMGGMGQKKHFYCPEHRKGVCAMGTWVRLDQAEKAVLGVSESLLTNYPPWMEMAMSQMQAVLAAAREQVPGELETQRARLAKLEQELGNLLKCLRNGTDRKFDFARGAR